MLKKEYKAILFDLDGTLLPMDMKKFTEGYFMDLYSAVNMPEIAIKDFTEAIWQGTYAMMKNDGSKTNREVFWEFFGQKMGYDKKQTEEMDAKCLSFYSHEFVAAKRFCMDNPLAKQAVEIAKTKADKVILATNAIFPMAGHRTRLGWLGLKEEDFDYVTCYEDEYFCKPNPKYFEAIMNKMGLEPQDCLMIGNDEREDMLCASTVGLDAFLITDTMIPYKEQPWNGDKGSFTDMLSMLEGLKDR